MTWNELVAIEPKLAGILIDALAFNADSDPNFCANAAWYGYGKYDTRTPSEDAPSIVFLTADNLLNALIHEPTPDGTPYGPGLKARVVALVGWDRVELDALRSEDAYHVAYQTIYNALPDCRHGWAC